LPPNLGLNSPSEKTIVKQATTLVSHLVYSLDLKMEATYFSADVSEEHIAYKFRADE
jgi:hypothetical protein